MLRRIALKLHRIVGLVVGIFILIASLTGSALVFREEIDRTLNPSLLEVSPAPEKVSLEEVVENVARAFPDERIRLIAAPRSATEPYVIRMERTAADLVYVDPYSGRILGDRSLTGSLMGFLFELHTKLLAGERGEKLVGACGLLLVGLCLSGLVLWWPGRRKVGVALKVSWRRKRRRVLDLHRAGGFWTLAFLVMAALTGASLVFYTAAGKVLGWATASEVVGPTIPAVAHTPDAPVIPLDAAVRVAQVSLPGAETTFISPASGPGAPIVIRMNLPGELHPNGRSYVYVDPYTGRALHVWNALEAGRGERLLNTIYPIHIGQYGGLAVRFLYVLLGLAPAGLAITGTMLWIRRRRIASTVVAPTRRKQVTRPRPGVELPTVGLPQ